MSADLKSLFPASPALKSALRPEDLGAEKLSRHLPWLSAPRDDLILTRQGDLIASALVDGMDSFTVEEGELDLVPASLARLIGQLGEGFGYHVSKLTLPAALHLKGFDADLDARGGEGFAFAVDRRWQAHLANRGLKRRVLMISLILRPTALKRLPLMGALFKAAFSDDMTARAERFNEAMGLLAGVVQGMGFRRLTISSGEWLGYLGGLIGQPVVKTLPMKGQFLADSLTTSQFTFRGKQVEIESVGGHRYGTIFGIKSYPARTWARMLDALELPFDITITNSFTPARNNEIEERIKRTARQMRASEDAAETLRQELYEAADNVASGRQVFGKHHLTVMVTGETPDELEEAASEVWRAGQDCGAVLVRESFAARAAWFAQAPCNWFYRPRTALISANNFAHLAALHRVAEGRPKAQSPWGETIIGDVLSFVVVMMLGTGLMAMVPTIAQSLAQTATGLGGVASSTFRTGGNMAGYGRSGAAGMIGAVRGAADLDAGGRRPSNARLTGHAAGQIGRSAVQVAMRLASRTPDKS